MGDQMPGNEKKQCGPLEKAMGSGCQSVLPSNDKGIVRDEEFAKHRSKLIDRSKQLYWWRSISRVFQMLAGVLIPAAIGLVTGGLVHGGGALTAPMMTAVTIIGGIAAASLAVGIGLDYYENLVANNQNLDMQDLSGKRYATHLARALNEIDSGQDPSPSPEKKRASDALKKPRQRATHPNWEEKARSPAAITINIA